MKELLKSLLGQPNHESARKGARCLAVCLAAHLCETYVIDSPANGFPVMRADLAVEIEREMLRLADIPEC